MSLYFSYSNTYGVDNTVMWAPLLEKAWAKLKGNYEISAGGLITNGYQTLSGAPTFSYYISSIGSSSDHDMTVD